MRLDKFLKVSRLIKRRTVAKEACDGGRIAVNGKVAKASTELKVGDVLTLSFGERQTQYKVLHLTEHVKKEGALEMYEQLSH